MQSEKTETPANTVDQVPTTMNTWLCDVREYRKELENSGDKEFEGRRLERFHSSAIQEEQLKTGGDDGDVY